MKTKAEIEDNKSEMVIDAENALLGRLASFTAKQALKGKRVTIVNSEKAVITGNKKSILEEYKRKRARGGSSQKGPYFPRQPERILKRTIRGMLPKTDRGKNVLRQIRCYSGVPENYKDVKKIVAGKPKGKVINLKDVSDLM